MRGQLVTLAFVSLTFACGQQAVAQPALIWHQRGLDSAQGVKEFGFTIEYSQPRRSGKYLRFDVRIHYLKEVTPSEKGKVGRHEYDEVEVDCDGRRERMVYVHGHLKEYPLNLPDDDGWEYNPDSPWVVWACDH